MCGGAAGNVLSPDDSVKFHSFSNNNDSNSNSNSESGDKARDFSASTASTSSSVSIALARSGVLCNLAEAHNVLGELDRATERLSDALRALQTVQNEAPLRCGPALGRVLGK